MSERAALRLEHLGFRNVYRYAGGKSDWTAAGLPRGGESAKHLSSGDVMSDDIATCHFRSPVSEAIELMHQSEHESCIAIDDDRVVLGSLSRTDAQRADPGATVEAVMSPGPATTRANEPLEELIDRLEDAGVERILISDPDGRLLGEVDAHEGRTLLKQSGDKGTD
jgi:CBS domain-containing protein